MNEYVGWLGVALQWARSQPKFSEWWYAGVLILGSAGVYWLTNQTPADPKAFVQGVIQTVISVAGGTQLTSTAANLLATTTLGAKLGVLNPQTHLGGTT